MVEPNDGPVVTRLAVKAVPDAHRESVWRDALTPYYKEHGIDVTSIPAGTRRDPFSAAALVYAYLADRASLLFKNSRAICGINWLAGSVMIAVGVALLLKAQQWI